MTFLHFNKTAKFRKFIDRLLFQGQQRILSEFLGIGPVFRGLKVNGSGLISTKCRSSAQHVP